MCAFGQRVTIRYPSGILQEAVLVNNDDGILNFQFGEFIGEPVGPVMVPRSFAFFCGGRESEMPTAGLDHVPNNKTK